MKKYFLIFFFIILIITFSNRTVQASSLTDILSSLTDTLYSLKKILSADIYMGSGYICNNNAHQCLPSPFLAFGGKSFDECAATCFSSSSRPIITSNMIKCQSNSDCALVDTECCVAQAIGQPSSSERSFASNPIRKGYLSDFVHNVNAYCHIYSPMCPDVAGRFYDYEYYTTCENNVCVAHKELWHPSTRYNCDNTTYQCSVSATGDYTSLETCKAACKSSPKPEITNDMRKCTSDYNCQIVETNCCGCSYGGDFKTKQSINKTYASQFDQTLDSYCSTNKLNICPALYRCWLTPTPKCISNLCTAVWPEVKPVTVTNTMKTCAKDTDCVLAESACCGCNKGGNDSSKIGLNKNYLTNYNDQISSYCNKTQAKCTNATNSCGTTSVICENKLCVAKTTQTPTPNPPAAATQWYTHNSMVSHNDHWYLYIKGFSTETWKNSIINYLTSQNIAYKNIIVQEITAENSCMALGCEVPRFFIEVSSEYFDKMISLGFITSTNPGSTPTYQNIWYKANVTLGNPQELWYQAVVSCVLQNSTKEKWEQCFKDYFAIQKIDIKQLIVGNVPASSCVPTGCQAPAIQVKVSQEYKAQMLALGFSEIDNLTNPVDQYILKIDLSKQGLLYGIDKTNNNIIYELVDKTTAVKCGDGKCDTLEKYLYEIDLNQNCLINGKEVANYKYCYPDCKSKMDTGKSVTNAEFNLLKLQCSNKPASQEPEKQDETKSFIPMPKKPVAQMTQAEKNSYIVELQTFLISLLQQLLDLLSRK